MSHTSTILIPWSSSTDRSCWVWKTTWGSWETCSWTFSCWWRNKEPTSNTSRPTWRGRRTTWKGLMRSSNWRPGIRRRTLWDSCAAAAVLRGDAACNTSSSSCTVHTVRNTFGIRKWTEVKLKMITRYFGLGTAEGVTFNRMSNDCWKSQRCCLSMTLTVIWQRSQTREAPCVWHYHFTKTVIASNNVLLNKQNMHFRSFIKFTVLAQSNDTEVANNLIITI